MQDVDLIGKKIPKRVLNSEILKTKSFGAGRPMRGRLMWEAVDSASFHVALRRIWL